MHEEHMLSIGMSLLHCRYEEELMLSHREFGVEK